MFRRDKITGLFLCRATQYTNGRLCGFNFGYKLAGMKPQSFPLEYNSVARHTRKNDPVFFIRTNVDKRVSVLPFVFKAYHLHLYNHPSPRMEHKG